MKLLVHADEVGVQVGVALACSTRAFVTVLESKDSQGRGEAAIAKFREAGVACRLIQNPAGWLRAIRMTTEAAHYELVVVGRLWRRGKLSRFFGTVPGGLFSRVRTNLLIAGQSRDPMQRVLIAVAGGPTSFQVVQWGSWVSKAFDAQPVLFHATRRAPGMFEGLPIVEESLSQFMRSNTVEALDFQMAARTLRTLGMEPELKLAHGTVVEELLAETRRQMYDLIVAGSSYNAGAPARWLLESVTERLVQRARCSVLVVCSGLQTPEEEWSGPAH